MIQIGKVKTLEESVHNQLPIVVRRTAGGSIEILPSDRDPKFWPGKSALVARYVSNIGAPPMCGECCGDSLWIEVDDNGYGTSDVWCDDCEQRKRDEVLAGKVAEHLYCDMRLNELEELSEYVMVRTLEILDEKLQVVMKEAGVA